MHIYFSGLGGTGIGPLALIAKQAGYRVSGSDQKPSDYIKYLSSKGIEAHIGQEDDSYIRTIHQNNPIDWFVYSSALPLEKPNHPELKFVYDNNIKYSKRDIFLSQFLENNDLKLIAAAGTHGKTTTTGMLIWLCSQLNLPISYSIGAKTNFSEMGYFDKTSEYFIYECDEFDKNFLSFIPYISVFPSIDWDHHEIYKTRQDYINSFIEFINKSDLSVIYKKDFDYLGITNFKKDIEVVPDDDQLLERIKLPGLHNRRNALLCIKAVSRITSEPLENILKIISDFPGTSRRFEKIADNVYTDYAHTPEEVEATLQRAQEMSDNVVVIYEPLTNRRQHFMKEQYKDTFKGIKKLYWVPSYLAREDPGLAILTPSELIQNLSNKKIAQPSEKNEDLIINIKNHINNGDMVVFLAGGGGGSLDEWARKYFTDKQSD